jgi:hypothetical protein
MAWRCFDEVPSQSVTQRPQTKNMKLPVVGAGETVMLGRCQKVEPVAIAPPMRRTFESTHEETLYRILDAHPVLSCMLNDWDMDYRKTFGSSSPGLDAAASSLNHSLGNFLRQELLRK